MNIPSRGYFFDLCDVQLTVGENIVGRDDLSGIGLTGSGKELVVNLLYAHPVLDALTSTRYNPSASSKKPRGTCPRKCQIKEYVECPHIQSASTQRADGTTAAHTMPCNLATSSPARTVVPCAFHIRSALTADFMKGAKLLK